MLFSFWLLNHRIGQDRTAFSVTRQNWTVPTADRDPIIATKADIESHFQGGEISDVKLMNGFGFIEYRDGNDARDAVQSKFVESSFGNITNAYIQTSVGQSLSLQNSSNHNRWLGFPRQAPYCSVRPWRKPSQGCTIPRRIQ